MEGSDSTGVPRSGRVVPRRGGRQVIPRPPTARPGGPAPWARVSSDRRRAITLERVRRALAASVLAQGGATASSVDRLPDPRAPAAVLVALFEEDREARVLLTRRAAHLRSHSGEVSFPGGRLDADESPDNGALREAAEEIGLDPSLVEVVGRLDPVTTFSSGRAITPIVGVLSSRPRLVPNPTEVEHLFDVALAELARDDVFREERWAVSGGRDGRRPDERRPDKGRPDKGRPDKGRPDGGDEEFPVWFFELPHDTVWGATARMLVDLLRRVLEV